MSRPTHEQPKQGPLGFAMLLIIGFSYQIRSREQSISACSRDAFKSGICMETGYRSEISF